uniref:Uncharacterized protein n=1 Tax=Staphylococcus Phage COMBAT-CF_PART1 TaxID=3239042 RepID=A0AB39C0H0_9VIRU
MSTTFAIIFSLRFVFETFIMKLSYIRRVSYGYW